MTKRQIRQQLYIFFQKYPACRLSNELVATWWHAFRRVDAQLFRAALQAAYAATDDQSPPTIQAVSNTLRKLQQLKLRDVAPHTPTQALAFILSLVRRHGPRRLAAERAAAPFPLILQTLKLIGYEELWSVVSHGNRSSHEARTKPTDRETSIKTEIANTYAALRLRFFETADLGQVLANSEHTDWVPQPALSDASQSGADSCGRRRK